MRSAEGRDARHLFHVFPTFGVGGSQVRTATLINRLGSGYRHTILSLHGDLATGALLEADANAHLIALPARSGSTGGVLALARLLQRHGPDLVLTYNWGAMEAVMAARLLGVPVLHGEDGFNPDEAHGQKRRRVLARRWLLRGVAAVVLPSQTLLRIARDIWQLPESRLRFIANGIDLRRFRPGVEPELRARLGCTEHTQLIGTVGHLNRGKNIAMLVRALADLPGQRDTRLAILGEGPEREALAQLASSLGVGDRVTLAGRVDDTAPWYRAFDVFAMSSLTEQMPLAVLEAMASGLPVVATDVGDTHDMVAEANRPLIVPAAAPADLSAALLRALRDTAWRETIGSANRERAEHRHDQRQMCRDYEALWSAAATGGESLRLPA